MQSLQDCIPTDSGWILSEASAINNRGQIVGTGTIDGKTHAFILTPEQ
jgi:probable HAF family extracellular repeat protein